MKKRLEVSVKNPELALKKARKHFQPVLHPVFGQPAFILAENSPAIVPGALVTDVLFLSRFVEMFGDLVEKEDYSVETYKLRNEEGDFKINEGVFKHWKRAGCLTE